MAQKWVRIWGKDFQRGCLYQVIALVIILPLFAACILIPLFFANQPGISKSKMLLTLIVPAALFLLVLFGCAFGFLFWSLRKRANWMDDIFVPLGLHGRSYAVSGRQYHGQVRGRNVDVLFTRGPMLSIYVSADVFTRAGFSNPEDVSQGLAKMFNKTALDWGNDALTVYSQEDAWGRAFIDQQEAQDTLQDLILTDTPFAIHQILVEPGYLMLRLYRTNAMFDFTISPEQGKHWVERLIRLAELAERQPTPEEPLAVSALSSSLRKGRAAKWGWVIVGGIVLMMLCIGVLAAGVIFILESGL